jgi:hypothetical protein
MIHSFADAQLDQALEQSRKIIGRFTDSFLSVRSVITFIIALAIALIIGRILAALLRRFAKMLSTRADKAQDLLEVNRLRRIETLTILTIALIRMILVVMAIYFWWVFSHPTQQPTALIGASAFAVILTGATIGPILRDLAYGGVMMAEHWYGVGDHVRIEPFAEMQGVVERVTLRSTRLRGLNGEVIWVSNQNIQGVRVAQRGVRTIAIDLFVSDLKAGLELVEKTNLRLPTGSLLVVTPLHIMAQSEVGANLWHITAVGETAPGREWLLEDYALHILHELDEELKHKVLQTDPIARYADSEADSRFARTIQNARKSPLQRRQLPSPESIAKQLMPKAALGRKAAKTRKEPPKNT